MKRAFLTCAVWAALAGSVFAVTLEQIVSREDPRFQCSRATLAIGRDGLVYLANIDAGNDGFMLRLTLDGAEKVGGHAGWMVRNAVANANGVIATANAHFGRKVIFYNAQLKVIAEAGGFLGNDQVGWNAPAHVEAGASGDFYAADQHRDRIVRLGPAGKEIKAYRVPRQPEGNAGQIGEFRVCEKTESFLVLTRGGSLRCVGFDGVDRWSLPVGVSWGEMGNAGGLDVDDEGVLYAIEARGEVVKKFSPDGKPLGEIRLAMGDLKASLAEQTITGLRVRGNDLLLKRRHPTEMFQRYDLATGALKRVVTAKHERFTATFPTDVWIAGQAVPFEIRFDAGSNKVAPRWRVWARPIETTAYRELTIRDGLLEVPSDCAGLWQIKVTPETQPLQHNAESEYVVRTWVEIRKPDAKGSVTVLTPENRVHFARGEEIPVSVISRGSNPARLQLELRTPRLTVWSTNFGLSSSAVSNEVTSTIPSTLTAALLPGTYQLVAEADGLTGVPQHLVIGPGDRHGAFQNIQYGDYTLLYPQRSVWETPDVVAATVRRNDRLGIDMQVDRLGTVHPSGLFGWAGYDAMAINALRKRLEADPLAPDPRKAASASPLLQTLAAYGAHGIDEMAILMGNDAGLPLGGAGFDNRKPEQIVEGLKQITKRLLPFRAFRGWTWSSNWWIFEQRGAKAANSPEEKAAYETALQRATETGAWDPVLDAVSSRRLGFAVEAQDSFNQALRSISTNLVTASACPYRNVESYPPVTLANVDETDIQAQWEQVAVPFANAFGIDFYKRSGKRGWSHPEIWNDAGTGDQVIPTTFQAVMRGADGVGHSGGIPKWTRARHGIPVDARSSYHGLPTVFRATYNLLRAYGPWLATLENNDPVAIAVSGRMFRIDDWTTVMGRHFARTFEAYMSCLHAHYPATLAFAEDLKPDGLNRYKAVIVVGQMVEFEPALATALRNARAAGVAIFHDGTCRESLVKEFKPLGVSFDKFEKDKHPASDDSAYWRFPEYCKANVPALRKALGEVLPPFADTDNPEVFLSERKSGDGRFLFVVNHTTPAIEPGEMWRVTLGIASRVPVVADVRLPADAKSVYDVFAMKRVEQVTSVQADLRSLPARLYAILPEPIRGLTLDAPKQVKAGDPFAWKVAIQGPKTKVPVRLRLLAGDGSVIEERHVAADASGEMVVPLNASAGDLTLEAMELFGGITTKVVVSMVGTDRRAFLSGTAHGAPGGRALPPDQAFGPHIRDVILTDGGSLAVMNAMNWDDNLYAVDVNTGRVRWRQRVGHYFAFAPQATRGGFAVQGFDFQSAEGYHLYLGDDRGRIERRFALYGLPKRLTQRFVPAILKDHINNFAVPENGAWVATAGDLGLAVWRRDGKLLWKLDRRGPERRPATLAAADARTLLAIEGLKAVAYEARTGKTLWQLDLAAQGEVLATRVSRDGKTIAVLATTDGGRVFVLRGGNLVRALPTDGYDVAVSADGLLVAVVEENLLKLYSVANGLQWILPGDDILHFPRFSPDDRRIAVSSELGTLYVAEVAGGGTLLERDLGAVAVPTWLPKGDLLLATWMGRVSRLDRNYGERWSTLLQPGNPRTDVRGYGDDATPTTRIATWPNAEPSPAPIAPNLLARTNSLIKFVAAYPHIQFAREPSALMDGSAAAPAEPWLHWSDIGSMAEISPFNTIRLDTLRERVRVTAITLFEDPAHPESWLRDARLEWWDAEKEAWMPGLELLSDSAAHTHRLTTPIESSRFRLVPPWGLCGNLRLAEIVLHGERIGPAHPDAFHKRPVAVLFDEGADLQGVLVADYLKTAFQLQDAYSGGRCLRAKADAKAYPIHLPPLGHAVPTWDFEIAEKPGPGQYRWLQFAWRGLDANATSIALVIGQLGGPSVGLHAGNASALANTKPVPLSPTVPREWQVQRVDLWQLFGKPARVQFVAFCTQGGEAAFDQILLGRTEADLSSVK